jgi:hypothetical protein
MDPRRLDKWSALDRVQVAKNCPASWRDMDGNDQVRHCSQCDRNVYNLSNMSRDEAAALIEETEGRLCVRYYRRRDGTMMTRDCGRPERAAFNLRLLLAGLLAALGLSGCTIVQGEAAGTTTLTDLKRELQHVELKLKQTKDPARLHDLRVWRKSVQRSIAEYKKPSCSETP